MNIGAGLENVLINAPQLVNAYMTGNQMDERFRDRDLMLQLSDSITKVAEFGQGLEDLTAQYKEEYGKTSTMPGAQGGMLLAVNEKYGQMYQSLYAKTFGDNPPVGVTPPPSTWIEGPHEIPFLENWNQKASKAADAILQKVLGANNPTALAQYMSEKQRREQQVLERQQLGGKAEELFRAGDQAGMMRLGIESGDSGVMSMGAGMNKPASAPTTQTYKDQGYEVTKEWNGKEWVPVGRNKIKESASPENTMYQKEIFKLESEAREIHRTSSVDMTPEQKANELNMINRKIDEYKSKAGGGSGGAPTSGAALNRSLSAPPTGAKPKGAPQGGKAGKNAAKTQSDDGVTVIDIEQTAKEEGYSPLQVLKLMEMNKIKIDPHIKRQVLAKYGKL